MPEIKGGNMTEQIKTPLTDAKVKEQSERAIDSMKLLAGCVVDADFARKLERDRARLVAALKLIKDGTYLDAEGPELRAQNAKHHGIACDLLRGLGEP